MPDSSNFACLQCFELVFGYLILVYATAYIYRILDIFECPLSVTQNVHELVLMNISDKSIFKMVTVNNTTYLTWSSLYIILLFMIFNVTRTNTLKGFFYREFLIRLDENT